MSAAATRGFGAGGVDCGVALLDVDDFSRLIDHERGAVRDARGFDQHPVRFADFAFGKIAEQGNLDVVLSGELLLGRSVIRTDS